MYELRHIALIGCLDSSITNNPGISLLYTELHAHSVSQALQACRSILPQHTEDFFTALHTNGLLSASMAEMGN